MHSIFQKFFPALPVFGAESEKYGLQAGAGLGQDFQFLAGGSMKRSPKPTR
jgi:hypothetical protein